MTSATRSLTIRSTGRRIVGALSAGAAVAVVGVGALPAGTAMAAGIHRGPVHRPRSPPPTRPRSRSEPLPSGRSSTATTARASCACDAVADGARPPLNRAGTSTRGP